MISIPCPLRRAMAFALALTVAPGVCAEERDKGSERAATARSGAERPVYVPPSRGAPKNRIGGGTRGSTMAETAIRVLAPEETGWSSTAQPKLYWYVSAASAVRAEITLIDERATDPVLEVTVAEPVQPGIHALDLAAYGVRLAPNADYQWSVALVVDGEQRSKDILASGAIRYVPLDAATLAQSGTSALARAQALAGLGYWYDALALLDEAEPGEDMTRRIAVRAALLREVGLGDVITP